MLTTLLWAFTGQHAATTYPILEYGGFVPNAPHRLFADSNGNPTFSNLMFGNKAVALVRRQLNLLEDVNKNKCTSMLFTAWVTQLLKVFRFHQNFSDAVLGRENNHLIKFWGGLFKT